MHCFGGSGAHVCVERSQGRSVFEAPYASARLPIVTKEIACVCRSRFVIAATVSESLEEDIGAESALFRLREAGRESARS